MFTGLVQDLGTIVEARQDAGPLRLTVACDQWEAASFELGESIATNGICLTVVHFQGKTFTVEAGQETLGVTTAARWRVGARVNLERALRLGDRLGGHLVLGHVDAVGRVQGRRVSEGVLHLTVSLPESIAPLVCTKGSIAIDGVSLTVNELVDDGFRVTLIPETRKRTTLDGLRVGDEVNLEADILARHLARMVALGRTGDETRGPGSEGGHLDLAFLSRHGYL